MSALDNDIAVGSDSDIGYEDFLEKILNVENDACLERQRTAPSTIKP